MGLKINKLYAFVCVDPEDGNEGIIAFAGPDGMMMPMIGADLKRVECLIPIADEIVKELGVEYKILYFSLDVDVEQE